MNIESLIPQIDWRNHSRSELVFIDVETTGLDKKTSKIIEIGCLRVSPKLPKPETFQVFLSVNEPLDQEIIDLTGITDEILEQHGLPFYRAFGAFKEFLGDSEGVAYNARFDRGMIESLTNKYNIPFKNYISDSMILCKKAFKLEGMKLQNVAEHLNVDYAGAHRADKDCEILALCHMAALIEVQKMP